MRTALARLLVLGLVAGGMLLPAAPLHAGMVTISGTVYWLDSGGGKHPARGIDFRVFDKNVINDTNIGGGLTDQTGHLSVTIDSTDFFGFKTEPYFRFVADSGGKLLQRNRVSPTGIFSRTYTAQTGVLSFAIGQNNKNFTIQNGTNAGRAFSIADALYTGEIVYGTAVRNGKTPLGINAEFPGSGTFYSTDLLGLGKKVVLASGDWSNWDVILHEYGHYLEHIDNLSASIGGHHTFGVSNITGGVAGGVAYPARGKLKGTELAWSEGLADYMAIAAEQVARARGALPNVPGTGDTFFYNVDLGRRNTNNLGEGDEASIARILYALASRPGINFGHIGLYQRLRDIHPTQLNDLWQNLFNGATDAQRVKYGDVFEDFGVSPTRINLDGVFGTPEFTPRSAPPQFRWDRDNNNANNQFQLIVFNQDYSRRILDVAIPGNVTVFTPSAPQWNQILGQQAGAATVLDHYVIAGSDTTDYTTGPYWSDARNFTVGPAVAAAAPEPSTLMLLGLGGLILLGYGWRQRRRGSRNTRHANAGPADANPVAFVISS